MFEQATADRRVSTLDSLGLDQLCRTEAETVVSGKSEQGSDHKMALTLNLSNSACKDVLLCLLVLDRLQHILNDGFC